MRVYKSETWKRGALAATKPPKVQIHKQTNCRRLTVGIKWKTGCRSPVGSQRIVPTSTRESDQGRVEDNPVVLHSFMCLSYFSPQPHPDPDPDPGPPGGGE